MPESNIEEPEKPPHLRTNARSNRSNITTSDSAKKPLSTPNIDCKAAVGFLKGISFGGLRTPPHTIGALSNPPVDPKSFSEVQEKISEDTSSKEIFIKTPLQQGKPTISYSNECSSLSHEGSFDERMFSMRKNLRNRVHLVRTRGSLVPLLTFSISRFDIREHSGKEKNESFSGTSKNVPSVSYAAFLEPLWSETRTHAYHYHYPQCSCVCTCGADDSILSQAPKDLLCLDDPDLKTGKHLIILNFPGLKQSIFPYAKKSEIKEEVNKKFRERFPKLTLTLSKIRKIKRKLKKISLQESISLVSTAISFVIFEKLIFDGFVSKHNLKLFACVCLFLAVKFNEPAPNLVSLLESMEKHLTISSKEILAREFKIFSSLEFCLFYPTDTLLPHYSRLLRGYIKK